MDRKFRPSAIGGTSLFVIFSVLCLAVFAVLCVSTARANGRLRDKAFTADAQYYAADAAAQETLAALRRGERPGHVQEENGVFYYSCPVSETQVLTVAVRVQGTQYQILRWQALSVTQWEADDSLHLFDGGVSGKE